MRKNIALHYILVTALFEAVIHDIKSVTGNR